MLRIGAELKEALNKGLPAVGLETTVLTHGFDKQNAWGSYLEMFEALREEGVVPAATGILGGEAVAGLTLEELKRLYDCGAEKTAIPDLPVICAKGLNGSTTAGAALYLCGLSGVRVLATGGLGGVHRGVEHSFDISGDLYALARFGGAVVSSGAKAVNDLPKTAELMETLGIPVVGYRTDELPAFTMINSGVKLKHRVDTPEEAAGIIEARDALSLPQAVLVANPVEEGAALDPALYARALSEAEKAAAAEGVHGPAVTPRLLKLIAEYTLGASVTANRALLTANARLAARISRCLNVVKTPNKA